MKFGTGAVVSAVGGVLIGGVVAFGASTALAEDSLPEREAPPADQSLLGQVEYGAR